MIPVVYPCHSCFNVSGEAHNGHMTPVVYHVILVSIPVVNHAMRSSSITVISHIARLITSLICVTYHNFNWWPSQQIINSSYRRNLMDFPPRKLGHSSMRNWLMTSPLWPLLVLGKSKYLKLSNSVLCLTWNLSNVTILWDGIFLMVVSLPENRILDLSVVSFI